MITPFCPSDIEKIRSKIGKSLRVKINSGRIGYQIQQKLIIGTTRDNLSWFDQVGELKTNWQLAIPQLTSTH
jgi:hypothetical protein